MSYKHLSIEEREKLQLMLWQKQSVRDIAKELGRNPSSISREINKNRRCDGIVCYYMIAIPVGGGAVHITQGQEKKD